MAFKKKKVEEEYDDEEFDEEEEDEEPVKVRKTTKIPKTPRPSDVEEGTQQPQITVNDVLVNHEQRLKDLESAFFRLKNI